jgi:septation ring formation regulator EzrA
MSIDKKNQLENTRLKLQELEQLYVETKQDASTSEHVRELTLRSLRKRINQFKEEITRFAARDTSGAPRS